LFSNAHNETSTTNMTSSIAGMCMVLEPVVAGDAVLVPPVVVPPVVAGDAVVVPLPQPPEVPQPDGQQLLVEEQAVLLLLHVTRFAGSSKMPEVARLSVPPARTRNKLEPPFTETVEPDAAVIAPPETIVTAPVPRMPFTVTVPAISPVPCDDSSSKSAPEDMTRVPPADTVSSEFIVTVTGELIVSVPPMTSGQ